MKNCSKLVALLLAMTVVLSVFTGCTNGQYTQQSETEVIYEEYTDESEESDEAEEYTEDVDVIYHGEEYTDPIDVSAYLYEWQELPPNFITKDEAQDLGWQSHKGNLWDVAPGKSIGGDWFGNREGLLPQGEDYCECDVNYQGGYRGGERLVYSTDDFDIYYTDDHYESFSQVYDSEAGYVWDEDIFFE